MHNLAIKLAKLCKVLQIIAKSQIFENFTIKRVPGNTLYDLGFFDRGDRIRTYDLVLPKNLIE